MIFSRCLPLFCTIRRKWGVFLEDWFLFWQLQSVWCYSFPHLGNSLLSANIPTNKPNNFYHQISLFIFPPISLTSLWTCLDIYQKNDLLMYNFQGLFGMQLDFNRKSKHFKLYLAILITGTQNTVNWSKIKQIFFNTLFVLRLNSTWQFTEDTPPITPELLYKSLAVMRMIVFQIRNFKLYRLFIWSLAILR